MQPSARRSPGSSSNSLMCSSSTSGARALPNERRRTWPRSESACTSPHASPRDLYETLQNWRSAGRLDGWSLLWLDGHVKSLMDICGACERIRYTPLSSSYRALLRHGIALYVLISPFYLIEDIGPSSFPLFVLAAYFLLGIEMVAEEIEEPFGASGDNLPLEHYCATIEASVREILAAPVDVAPRDA